MDMILLNSKGAHCTPKLNGLVGNYMFAQRIMIKLPFYLILSSQSKNFQGISLRAGHDGQWKKKDVVDAYVGHLNEALYSL